MMVVIVEMCFRIFGLEDNNNVKGAFYCLIISILTLIFQL